MAYEFKKLGDVEALEDVPENANALIEVDGAIKRVPGSNLGGGGGIPTAILRLNTDSGDTASTLSMENLSAGVSTRLQGAVYSATCDNMTYDEAKAILLAGEPLDARLVVYLTYNDMSIIEIVPAYSGGVASTDSMVLCGFSFAPALLSDLIFYWFPDGTITNDSSYSSESGGDGK